MSGTSDNDEDRTPAETWRSLRGPVYTHEQIEHAKSLARERIKDGTLPATPVTQTLHKATRDTKHFSPCAVCADAIHDDYFYSIDTGQTLRAHPQGVSSNPEMHVVCFHGWCAAVTETSQCGAD